jgi:hypothetical protein
MSPRICYRWRALRALLRNKRYGDQWTNLGDSYHQCGLWADDGVAHRTEPANTGHANSPLPKVQSRTIPMSRRQASASDCGSCEHVRYNASHLVFWKSCEYGCLSHTFPCFHLAFHAFSLTFLHKHPTFYPAFLRPGSFDARQSHTSIARIGVLTSKTSLILSDLYKFHSDHCVSPTIVCDLLGTLELKRLWSHGKVYTFRHIPMAVDKLRSSVYPTMR